MYLLQPEVRERAALSYLGATGIVVRDENTFFPTFFGNFRRRS